MAPRSGRTAKKKPGRSAVLTPKQSAFVAEYLVDLNATQAAIRAGYSEKTAHVIGNENLSKPEIAAALAVAMAKRAERVGVKADDVIREVVRLAFSDMRRFTTWGPDGVSLIDSSQLTEDEARAVSEVSQSATGAIRFKLHDKAAALDKLMRHLGLMKDDGVSDHTVTIVVRHE